MATETETTTTTVDATAATGNTANAADTDSKTATDADAGKGQGTAEEGGKTAEAAKVEGSDEETKPDAKKVDEPQGAPEKYEDFTLPDGFALEGDRLEMAHEFAKTNNWTQAQAQEGVNSYLKFRAAELEHERGQWGAQSESEYGKDFKTIANGAQRALVLAEEARPGITKRLDDTNLGNHPDVLWAFNQLGLHLKPGQMKGMRNETANSSSQSLADKLYPPKQ